MPRLSVAWVMLQRVPPDIRILTPGLRFFSRRTTRRPRSAAEMAAISPAAPAPITATSNDIKARPRISRIRTRIKRIREKTNNLFLSYPLDPCYEIRVHPWAGLGSSSEFGDARMQLVAALLLAAPAPAAEVWWS